MNAASAVVTGALRHSKWSWQIGAARLCAYGYVAHLGMSDVVCGFGDRSRQVWRAINHQQVPRSTEG